MALKAKGNSPATNVSVGGEDEQQVQVQQLEMGAQVGGETPVEDGKETSDLEVKQEEDKTPVAPAPVAPAVNPSPAPAPAPTPVVNVNTPTDSGSASAVQAVSTMKRVRLRNSHNCSIGGVRYSFKKGEVVSVPENVRRVLAEADLLLPL